MSKIEKSGDPLGNYDCLGCGCNCGTQPMTVYNSDYMKCSSCTCNMIRTDVRLKIRVYVHGQMSVKAMEALLELARVLGVDDENTLARESDMAHYIEVPAAGIHARLEIAKIKGH